MIRNHLKTAWRNIVRNRRFTVLNVLGLSTGLASAILIYLWVADELKFDTFNNNDERLYKAIYNIQTENDVLTLKETPAPLGASLFKAMPEVESYTAVNPFMDWYQGDGMVSFNNNTAVRAKGIFADSNFFNVFSYGLTPAERQTVLAAKYGVVITERLAKRLFNNLSDIKGKTITWKHKLQLKEPIFVAGICATPPANSSNQFDIVFNSQIVAEAEENVNSWRGTYAETYLILKKGTDINLFNKKVADFAKLQDPANKNCTVWLQQFSKIYLYDQYANGYSIGGRIRYVRLFLIIALFIIIIACINFMNLSTAQASAKMKEIGVRKVIGADRKDLFVQFMIESLSLVFLSLLVAIVIIESLLPGFNHITGKQLQFGFGSSIVVPIMLITLFTGLFSGFYPAFYLSGFNPLAVLKNKLNTSVGEIWVRKGLVIFQFAISSVFVIGFVVIKKQIDLLQTRNLGYNRGNVINFKKEGKAVKNPETFLQDLKKITTVDNASCMAGTMLDATEYQMGFSWRGDESDRQYSFRSPRVSYGAIETLGIPVIAGRSFDPAFNDDDSKIVLSESAVKKMRLKDPVGKVIMNGKNKNEIIGVVKDFQYGSARQTAVPLILRFRNAYVCDNILVKIKAGSTKETIGQIANAYKQFNPDYQFEFTFLDEDYQALYKSEENTGILSSYFAALAIIISCLGLFGLAAFTAQKRKKEIGIRKVIGASVAGIVLMLSRDFLKLLSLSFVIAFPVAWWVMNEWLNSFAYRVTISPMIFISTMSIVTILALLSIGFQTIRAAIANPVKSLQTE
jgi:putative ABC transport system permease protein